MTYRPTIVVVDDNPNVLENFLDKAELLNVALKVFETWDVAKEFLESSVSVDAIILDAKGKLTADRQESSAHLQQAISWLNLQEGKGQIIPYAVHTAYYDDMEAFSAEQDGGRMFRKEMNSESVVLNYLKTEILNTPKHKIISKYSNAYEAYNRKIIQSKYEHMFMDMLFCLENEDYRKKNLNVIRDVLESVFITLIDDFEFIPLTFKNHKGSPNLEWCTRFLEGKQTKDAGGKEYKPDLEIPYYISSLIRYIKEVTSEYSHFSEYPVVKTSFICAAYAMMEVLEWIPGFINANFEY